jgi:hypothetical protein
MLRTILSRSVGTFVALGTSSLSFCNSASSSNDHDTIAIFLKPESKKLVESYLKSKGIADPHVDYICINGKASKASRYVFEPLYSERTAFRLKGLLKLEDGRIVGVGRASNMVGELRDNHVEVSLPIIDGPISSKKSDPHSLQELQDLPTRLVRFSAAFERPMWKGRLPSDTVDGRHYSPIKATWIRFPTEQQIVLDGHLCSRAHFDSDNHACAYDRASEIVANIVNDKASEVSTSSSNETNEPTVASTTTVPLEETEEDDDDKETCPVCRYLKKGPCKPEFIGWDNCMKSLTPEQEVTACFDMTKNMMRCMRKYEYYDIMTAGTDFSRLDEADALAQQQEKSKDSSAYEAK